MMVTISAVRDGKDITFQIVGKDAQDVFRQWQAGPLSKNCTRAALGDRPAPIEQRDMPLMQLSDGLRSDWGDDYVMMRCAECGVATHTVKNGNYGGRDIAVHRSGCSGIKPGHLIVASE
jgi:hypothetical protein